MDPMRHKQESADAAADQDLLLAMDAVTGLYVLALITTDLRRTAHSAPRDWLESVTGFALYLRDLLPEEYQVAVPTLPEPGPGSGARRIA